MQFKTRRSLLSLVTCAALFLAGSGKADTGTDKPRRVIEITGDDTMHYSRTEIVAKPGEALAVQLTNLGQLPRAAMSHNWVLLKPMSDADIAAFAASVLTMAPTYLPDDKTAILAHTNTLGPKETDLVEFNAPTKPGEYPFICTFPGHFLLMRGKLIVK